MVNTLELLFVSVPIWTIESSLRDGIVLTVAISCGWRMMGKIGPFLALSYFLVNPFELKAA